jgi:hypothetical protein
MQTPFTVHLCSTTPLQQKVADSNADFFSMHICSSLNVHVYMYMCGCPLHPSRAGRLIIDDTSCV